jgi:hypothetical protein
MAAGTQRTAGALELLLKAAVLLALIVAAARPLLATFQDNDFFWHLETGRWIWEHKALPQEFLFSLTAPHALTEVQRVTMTSYWIVQVLYHLLHSCGDLTAIALLRAALLSLLVGSLVLRCSRRDGAVLLAVALLAVVLTRGYPLERPQIFSFVFFSLLLLALERLKSAPPGAAASLWAFGAVPLLMTLWANCHGAFIVGQGVLMLYALLEGLKFARPSLEPLPPRRYRLLVAACAAGILAGLVNPNTYHVYAAARLPAWSKTSNLEYASTVEYFQASGNPVMLVFWLLLGLTALGFILSGKRPDITRLALVAGTAAVAFLEVRHIPFFMLSALPAVEDSFSRAHRWGKPARAFLLTATLATGLAFLPGDLASLKDFRGANKVNGLLFPADAASFIQSRGIGRDLYTASPWGGYLLWQLAPAKVFIDGRNSSYEVYLTNAAVEAGDGRPPAGPPPWRAIFKRYGIRTVVLPVFKPWAGDVMELFFALGWSPDWAPVFIGVNSVVFVELTADNRWATPPAGSSRDEFFEVLVGRCRELIARTPTNPFPHIGLGELLSRLHRYDEARAAYRDALRLLPFSPLIRDRLAGLPAAADPARR